MTDQSIKIRSSFRTSGEGGGFSPRLSIAGLTKEDLLYLCPLFQRHLAKAGECLWHEGDVDDRLGVIVRGRVKMLKETQIPGHPMTLGLFGPGAMVIDFSFEKKSARETSGYAVGDLEILFLSGVQLEKIMTDRPILGHRIYSMAVHALVRQLRHAYRRLAVFF